MPDTASPWRVVCSDSKTRPVVAVPSRSAEPKWQTVPGGSTLQSVRLARNISRPLSRHSLHLAARVRSICLPAKHDSMHLRQPTALSAVLCTAWALLLGGSLAAPPPPPPPPIIPFTVTVFQPHLQSLSPGKEAQLAALANATMHAAAAGSDLLVCPEMYLTGYNLLAVEEAEPRGGPSYAAASALAKAHNISLLFTYAEAGATDEGGDSDGSRPVYDAAVLFYRDGRPLLDYRKTNLAAGESVFLTPGTTIGPVVEVDGVRIGVLICFDIFLPEPARLLALQRADIVLVPTANGYPPSSYNTLTDLIVPARALENNAAVVYNNWVQFEGPKGKPFPQFFSFYGRSTAADAGGVVRYRGPAATAALAHVRFNVTAGQGGGTAMGRPAADVVGLCNVTRLPQA